MISGRVVYNYGSGFEKHRRRLFLSSALVVPLFPFLSFGVFITIDQASRTARRRLFFSSVLVMPLFPFLSFGEVQNQKMIAKPSSKELPLSLEQVTASALRNNPAIKAAHTAWQMKRDRIQ